MANRDTRPPSNHLLRTLAAVPVSSEILDLGCGRGRHTDALLRLGFPIHACDPRPAAVNTTRERIEDLLEQGDVKTVVQEAPLDALDYPDATFDWVVAVEAETYVSNESDLQTLFEEGRRLLKPGGWLYLTLPAIEGDGDETEGREGISAPRFSEETIEAQRTAADLAEASTPTRVEDGPKPRIRAIYRRVEPHTPV
jgi:SAM-dependent methyltransferase